MKSFAPQEFSYSFTVNHDRLFVAPIVAGGAVVAGKLIWDVILSKVVENIASEVGKGIGQVIVQRLFGSRSGFEKEVSGQLNVVVQKLDEILAEIRALGDLVQQINRQSIRELAKASVAAYIDSITDLISLARKEGHLSDNVKEELKEELRGLNHGIDTILRYEDDITKAPLGLPMYAAAEAGMVMLLLGYRLVGLDLGPEKLARLVAKFDLWHLYLEEQLKPLLAAAAAETAYLERFPKSAPMSMGNTPEGGWVSLEVTMGNHQCFLLTGVIDGGVAKPFVVVEVQKAPPFTYWDDAQFKALVQDAQQFPTPYQFVGRTAPSSGQPVVADALGETNNRLYRLVGDLNARRDALLQQVKIIRGIQDVMESLKAANERMRKLLPT